MKAQVLMTKEGLFILAKYTNDIIGAFGLSLFGYGTWLIAPELSYICVGIISMRFAYKSAGN